MQEKHLHVTKTNCGPTEVKTNIFEVKDLVKIRQESLKKKSLS